MKQEKLCKVCLDGLKFQLSPSLPIENSFVNHPALDFDNVNSTVSRAIQKKLYLVYNILYFSEEMLIRLEQCPDEDLATSLLDFL